MKTITVEAFEVWRSTARQLLMADVPPSEVSFRDKHSSQRSLFDSVAEPEQTSSTSTAKSNTSNLRVPRAFLDLAEKVSCHREANRYDILYRTLWRLTHGEPHLLEVVTDDDVYRLVQMEKEVRRDAHKAKAFIRFRRVLHEGQEQFIAWHRPDHRILRLIAPFLSRRFVAMHWTVLTPDESVSWDEHSLTYGPGVPREQAPEGDELEDLWRTYYGAIFNPARIKLQTMTREMPRRHWATLPEAQIIDELLAEAPRRVDEMIARQEGSAVSAAMFLPKDMNLDALRTAAAACQGCELCRHATQTVMGEGPETARLVLVGEQPGHEEDLAGRPFIGPAGKVLDEALQAAGLDRREVYITNAVKHFKFEERGPHRLHKKPAARETIACRPWVEAELQIVRPQVLVCLGATAAQSLIGRDFRIQQQRGTIIPTPWCKTTLATYHPSAVLRAASSEQRERIAAQLVSDLQLARQHLTL